MRMRFILLCLSVVMSIAVVPSASALTAEEIVASVCGELDNVTDYTASVSIDHDATAVADMTGGTLQYKRPSSSGAWKVKMYMGTGYSGSIQTDGVDWNFVDSSNELWAATLANGKRYIRDSFGTDMFNMEEILASETWTKDPDTATVNNVSCYRLYTTKSGTNYEVWIDVATAKKVIRVKSTDATDVLQRQLDYSSYTTIEDSVLLPCSITVAYYSDGAVALTSTYTFSSISINDGLSDAAFDVVNLNE